MDLYIESLAQLLFVLGMISGIITLLIKHVVSSNGGEVSWYRLKVKDLRNLKKLSKDRSSYRRLYWISISLFSSILFLFSLIALLVVGTYVINIF